MNTRNFMEDLPFLSYYQSALRNIIVFTTLSIAFLRQGMIYNKKNKIYNIFYIVLSFILLTIAVKLIWILFKDTKIYGSDNKRSNEVHMYLYILYILFGILCIFNIFIIYRIYLILIN